MLTGLEKLNRCVKRTHLIDRTEEFILAQGWAETMDPIHDDLVHMRNGIVTIVSNCDAAQFVVMKVAAEIVTIDVTKNKRPGRRQQNGGSEMMEKGTVNYVERIQITVVKLTDENKAALNRFGYLGRFSLADALFEASELVFYTDRMCSFQLLQRSAELLHPDANWIMGANLVNKDPNSALSHFQVASSRQHKFQRYD